MAAEKRWLPLEANPDVMNEFSWKLGLPETVSFHDVFGLDPELLGLIPRPVLAVLLLFPLPPKEAASEAGASEAAPTSKPFFMKQTIGNACGTIGLLHAVGNASPPIDLASGSFFDRFFRDTQSLTPAERGKRLEESTELEVAHSSAATAGDTRPPSLEDDTNLHFIAFVVSDGVLYELDGRKPGPVAHGDSTPSTLLEDAARAVRGFMERSRDSLLFNVIALCGQQ